MPHSSGGGHSSHGSHGSSRSSAVRYGKRYYRGANRYVYYRNGIPQYYFSDKPYTPQTAKREKIMEIFRNIISMIIGGIFAVSGLFSLPHKVKQDYDTEIYINDEAQLLTESETNEMEAAFRAFQDKTGVTPAFYTIFASGLEKQGVSLYDYSYNLYVNTFDDEKHWLVVYCMDDEKEYWQWEGIIGDDCESIISTDLENEFTQKLHRSLENNPEMLSASVINTFETIGNKTGRFSFGNISWAVLEMIIGGFFAFEAVRKIISLKNTDKADDPRLNSLQCPTAEKEPETVKCQYCGGEFVAGLHTTCPHCGAPVEDWE